VRRRASFATGGLAIGVLALACTRDVHRAPGPPPDPLAHLRAFEESRRREARFLETEPQDRSFGADPYDVAALSDGRLVGILRGRDALVLLSSDLHEVARVPTPRAPSAVAVHRGPPANAVDKTRSKTSAVGRARSSTSDLATDDILVTSEIEPVLAHYRPAPTGLERLADIALDNVVAARDVVIGPEGIVYVVEEHDDRLLTLRFRSAGGVERSERRVPRGPIRLARTQHALFVASLLDHTITAYALDRRGLPLDPGVTASIDGPYWGVDAFDLPDGGALVVAGGAEDHPLDRRGGFFGYVDSFAHVYRWSDTTRELRRTAEINVSEHGLIVPKAIAFTPGGDAIVTSYGGTRAVRLSWIDGPNASPALTSFPLPPGATALTRTSSGFVAADPLLDVWVGIDAPSTASNLAGPPASPVGVHAVHADAGVDARTDRERLGEALFFTGLMAPASSSDGAKSRFSCETCHFEGYVDGRVHHTGRGDVHATTKPLVGLFNNRPHFSRALDPDLSAVAENEFRVAGAPASSDPHFDLVAHEVPWLADLGVPQRRYDAAELRLSLMSFLMSWTHRTNPRAAVARAFTDDERAGAVAFRERCEACHQARAASDEPSSRIPFERWESLVLGGGGPLVWGSDAYEKTGIVPYVHERGARVPSLRRLYKKRPYFTNGSAPDLATVLRRARFGEAGFSHDDAAPGARIDEATVRTLGAFIDLL
jgi:hypothetical protein